MAEQYNEVTNRLVSTRNADNPAVNHIVTGSDAVYDDNYPLLVNGYIECDTTPISGPTGNPHEQGWCEEEVVEGEGTGKYILTEDATIELDKSYYKPIGARQAAINNQLRTSISDLSGVVLHANEYNEATIHEGDNPQANGWYELSGTTYVLTTDTTVVSGKTYYIRVAKITSNEDKIINKEDGYVPTAGAVGRAMGANFEDNLQSTSTVKGLTANMGRILNENKANINGYYETMSVGSAKNLDGENIDEAAYLIRPTGGESNEVANGVTSVLGMEGNSAMWNQLVKNGDFSDGIAEWNTIGLSQSVIDGVLTLTREASTSLSYFRQSIPTVSGHKYYYRFSVKANIDEGTQCLKYGFDANVEKNISNSWTFNSSLVNNNRNNLFYLYYTTTAGNESFSYKNFIIVDLTLLGIDNLTTVAEVEAWLAEHVGTKPYYAYNAGTILSAQTLGFKTYSRNLLNPDDGLAKLIPYTYTANSNKYTVKGFPSGAAVTYTPDNTGVAVDVTEEITDNTFDISPYGSGILYIPNATANTYVCMKYDGAMDGDAFIVPYKENTYNFDVRKVYGKTGGSDTYVQCFPSGMKSIGTAHDILTEEKAIRKIDTRYFHFFNLTYNPGYKWLYAQTSIIAPSLNNAKANILSSDFLTVSSNNAALIDERNISYESNYYLKIRDISLTEDQLRMFLQGKTFSYEMRTPIIYTDLIYSEDGGQTGIPFKDILMNIIVDNWSIEEQLMTDYDEQGNPTSVPATIQTEYSIDAVEAIKTLEESSYFESDIHDNFAALIAKINEKCASVLGGTFSISDSATNKLFTFGFTENASTNSTEENTETI